MPKENRSSNTEMVSVPRELTQMAADAIDDLLADGVSAVSAAAWVDIPQKLRALLAQPVEQHQDEPVGYQVRTMTDRPGSQWTPWRECCDTTRAMHSHEVGRFNLFGIMREIRPVYTHADPGEVERLRTGLDHMREERDDLSRKLDRFYSRTHGIKNLSVIEQLSDKLAERDSLLQQALQVGGLTQEWHDKVAALSASAEPSAPTVSIPDGYCLMPRRLTAENGAKALLLGEFKLNVVRECPECRDLEEPVEGCDVCDGEGEFAQSHTIPWDQIKFIYSVAVKGLALQPNTDR